VFDKFADNNSYPLSSILAIAVLTIATIYLAFVPAQSDFSGIISSFGLAFVAYAFLSFYNKTSLKLIFLGGILIRLILLFAFPNLSDDIYRFVWDGQLSTQGMNPYGYLPSELISNKNNPYWQELFINMNSPEYYTIYPPFAQFIFYLSTWAGENIWWSSFIIKTIFLLAEVFTFFGIVKLLTVLKKDTSLSAIYFLNPLILIEGMGNLHFEIVMVCFLVWAVYFVFVRDKIVLGALLFTLSIASKLLPLMFLPYFLFKLENKKRVVFFLSGFIFLVLAFLPIILGLDFANFGSSIDLYFQKFEFNGGIYYLLRYLGKLWSGYNMIQYIGPLLGVTAVFLIMKKAYSFSEFSLFLFLEFAFYSFCAYLLLATTVHPWYLCIPLLLSVFVQLRFAVVWSFLIFLSYINYSYDPYYENLWIVALEYVLLYGFIFWEMRNRSNTAYKSA